MCTHRAIDLTSFSSSLPPCPALGPPPSEGQRHGIEEGASSLESGAASRFLVCSPNQWLPHKQGRPQPPPAWLLLGVDGHEQHLLCLPGLCGHPVASHVTVAWSTRKPRSSSFILYPAYCRASPLHLAPALTYTLTMPSTLPWHPGLC